MADIAEVTVNGQHLSPLWAPPFRMVITRQVKTGTNLFEIKVTNTWHNRLAYDAAQPEAQRKTWTINSLPASAPTEDAGLVGPVVLHIGKVVDMDAK